MQTSYNVLVSRLLKAFKLFSTSDRSVVLFLETCCFVFYILSETTQSEIKLEQTKPFLVNPHYAKLPLQQRT